MADWRPTAGPAALAARADLYEATRAFFRARQVLEVETPLVSAAMNPDPNIDSCHADGVSGWGYLHTSPEFPMKRLLAAGSGPIWQLCRVFRAGEAGRKHNPEFTLLEWYRPGFDENDLMAEVAALLQTQVPDLPVRYVTFQEAFIQWAGFDPTDMSTLDLKRQTRRRLDWKGDDREEMLDLWLAAVIEPALPEKELTFITHWPANRAALAELHPETKGQPRTARRFEAYWHGMELANGYYELGDPKELRERWNQDLRTRVSNGKLAGPMDERLLAALEAGMPACAGVALGVDRWLMALLGTDTIADVIAFPSDRA